MPIFKSVNHNFFKKWSPNMAYVLGFFAADGNMIRNKLGGYYISIEITDKELLEKIRGIMESDHKISSRRRPNKINQKTSYRLRIGNKTIFNDLLDLGITPGKSLTIELPRIPSKYFNHFVRGYFDGDGCVNICTYQNKYKNKPSTIINSTFTSGSKSILKKLKEKLTSMKILKGGTLYYHAGYRLGLSINDSFRLYKFMYANMTKDDLYLIRKKEIFEKYFFNR